jgi:hypothetical protein
LADLENIFIISKLKLETINNKLSSLDISLTTAYFLFTLGGHLGCDRMVVGLTTTCAISAYHH